MSAAICPACKSVGKLFLTTKDYDYRISDEEFSYFRCTACGLIFIAPIPENLDQYYHEEYYEIPKSIADLRIQANVEYYKLDILRKFVSGGTLLEIGPSYGAFALLAKEAGFDVSAIEMDTACCTFLDRYVGIRVIHSDDPVNALRLERKYNAIVLWHVIEHLPNPLALLQSIAEHLLPNGIVVLASPNPDSFQFRVLGARWRHLQAPRHLTLISISWLLKQANQLGLTHAWTTTSDVGSLWLNSFGWQRSLMSFSRAAQIRELLRQVGRVVHKLFIPIEQRDHKGAAYVVVLKKP